MTDCDDSQKSGNTEGSADSSPIPAKLGAGDEPPKAEGTSRLEKPKRDWHFFSNIVLSALTLVILSFQSLIFYRQARMAEDSIHLSTRPHIFANVQPNIYDVKSQDRKALGQHWIIENRGRFPVVNLQISQLHFIHYAPGGWMVFTPLGGLQRERLNAGEVWDVDISFIYPITRDINIEGHSADPNQFFILVLQFQREIDGYAYMYIEPFILNDDSVMHWAAGKIPSLGGLLAMSGALAKACEPAAELVYEYFRRRPVFRNYELYNLRYLLDYKPTGCVGPIEWVSAVK